MKRSKNQTGFPVDPRDPMVALSNTAAPGITGSFAEQVQDQAVRDRAVAVVLFSMGYNNTDRLFDLFSKLAKKDAQIVAPKRAGQLARKKKNKRPS